MLDTPILFDMLNVEDFKRPRLGFVIEPEPSLDIKSLPNLVVRSSFKNVDVAGFIHTLGGDSVPYRFLGYSLRNYPRFSWPSAVRLRGYAGVPLEPGMPPRK